LPPSPPEARRGEREVPGEAGGAIAAVRPQEKGIAMNAYLFLVTALVLNAAANLLIKYSNLQRAASGQVGAGGLSELIHTYLTFPFVAGMVCFGLNLLFYTQALKKLPLSLAYPLMVSLGYVVILAVSSFILPEQFPGERMSAARYAGAGLMLGGLWLLVR
jgi:multidrug transporter EmrE-like cation transporter